MRADELVATLAEPHSVAMAHTSKAIEGRRAALEKAGPGAMSDAARKERIKFAREFVQSNPGCTKRAVIKAVQDKFGIAISGEYLDRAMQGKGPKRKSPTKPIKISGGAQGVDSNVKAICDLLREHCSEVTALTFTVDADGTYEVSYEIVTKITRTLGG